MDRKKLIFSTQLCNLLYEKSLEFCSSSILLADQLCQLWAKHLSYRAKNSSTYSDNTWKFSHFYKFCKEPFTYYLGVILTIFWPPTHPFKEK